MEFLCDDKPIQYRKPVKTITDATSVYLSCSNCEAKLVEIVVTHKFEKELWKVRAECPFCGDKSYVVGIAGEIRFMPASNRLRITDSELVKNSLNEEILLFRTSKNDAS